MGIITSKDDVRRIYAYDLAISGGSSSQDARRILDGRARQLVRLTGYRMGARVIGTLDAEFDQVASSIIMLAGPAPDDASELLGVAPYPPTFMAFRAALRSNLSAASSSFAFASLDFAFLPRLRSS